MKAVTVWQPRATLIALGVKSVETRSWKPSASAIGQPLAIHAGAKRFGFNSATADWIRTWPMDVYGAVPRPSADAELCDNYPLGAVVASCRLVDVVPTTPPGQSVYDEPGLMWADDELLRGHGGGLSWWAWGDLGATESPEHRYMIRTSQAPFGDFSPGRFAWLLDDVAPTTERCPACWGEGVTECNLIEHEFEDACRVCDGAGSVDPIPAKGAQRLFEWTP